MGTFTYLKNLFRDPQIASVTPSSQFAVRRLCRAIDFSRPRVIVEYGPGLGVFTRHLLAQLGAGSRVLAFETNGEFVSKLRRALRDPRLELFNESCEAVVERLAARSLRADYIISGIPFSMIPGPVKERILENTARALQPDGRFLTYQFVPPLASFDNFLRRPMERWFELRRVQYELLNIPPLRIYEAQPKAGLQLVSRRAANE